MIRHSGWTIAGFAVPIAVGFKSIPLLIDRIGDARFGFLSIAWILIGYFSVLDLGIGRALTHAVARRLADDPSSDVRDLVWTGGLVLTLLGVLGGVILAVGSPWIVGHLVTGTAELRGEGIRALMWLALAIPLVLLSAALTGILQARQAFRTINLIQMPMGALLYAAPLAATGWSVTLPTVILPLVIVRALNCSVLAIACAREIGGFGTPRFERPVLAELLAFGGWMTVSNILSPIMVNMDRLFISSRLAVSAVTYYVTPFEVVSKILLIPSAVATVGFPEFSRLARLGDWPAMRQYLLRATGLVLAVLIPVAGGAAILAHPVLAWWISPELADRSAPIMRILALGVVVNGAAYIPFAFIQGLGRSDVTARFHVIELILYLPTLFALISMMGLSGVAVAWLLRVSIDALLLFGYAGLLVRRRERVAPILPTTGEFPAGSV